MRKVIQWIKKSVLFHFLPNSEKAKSRKSEKVKKVKKWRKKRKRKTKKFFVFTKSELPKKWEQWYNKKKKKKHIRFFFVHRQRKAKKWEIKKNDTTRKKTKKSVLFYFPNTSEHVREVEKFKKRYNKKTKTRTRTISSSSFPHFVSLLFFFHKFPFSHFSLFRLFL